MTAEFHSRKKQYQSVGIARLTIQGKSSSHNQDRKM